MKSTLYSQIAERLAIAANAEGVVIPFEVLKHLSSHSEHSKVDDASIIPVIAEAVATLPRYEYLVLALASALPVSSTGYLSLGVKVAPSAFEAVKFLIELAELIVPVVSISLSESSIVDQGFVTFSPNVAISPAAESVLTIICLIASNKELSLITGRTRNLSDVELREGISWPIDELSKALGTTVKIGDKKTVIRFTISALNSPNPSADIATFKQLQEELHAKKDLALGSISIKERVTQLVMENIRFPKSKEEIARQLKMSERQLRYSLNKTGATYQQILKQCRTEYATKLLVTTSHPRISEIADQLNYSDTAAFSQAFKQWTGLSPKEYREEYSK
ncbi:helix-turn-helix domain-containing protein [Zhongshania arctica]|uniref:Helix-turn-helix domain-containing protein n=1 Tax=Zhongshania arctica TaxID=3238302 RepID=A0ABV3TWE9_9GAMM